MRSRGRFSDHLGIPNFTEGCVKKPRIEKRRGKCEIGFAWQASLFFLAKKGSNLVRVPDSEVNLMEDEKLMRCFFGACLEG